MPSPSDSLVLVNFVNSTIFFSIKFAFSIYGRHDQQMTHSSEWDMEI